jgi:exonuclease III
VNGVIIASLYAPNGNPQPGPKFTYKLAWLERLSRYAAELQATGVPVVLAGDYNVVPTERDMYPSKSYAKNALVQPESRGHSAVFWIRAGSMRSAPFIPTRPCTPSGTTCGTAGRAMPGCASIIFC